MAEFTHLDARGRARMVDVGDKPSTRREAVAEGRVSAQPETVRAIREQSLAKGDVLAVARIAGIQAAKRTSELIPLCHTLALDSVEVAFELDEAVGVVRIVATARNVGRTGVEMEAMTAVSIAALALYDMCKAIDRGMRVGPIRLLRKSGGRSGLWEAERS